MIAIIAFAGLVACQVPQPNEVLPAATGPQKTGRVSFHWKDTSRAELETSAPDDKRELNSGSGAQPFLWVQKTLPAPPTPEQLQRAGRTRAQYDSVIAQMLGAWERRLGAVSGGAVRVYIDRPGVEHIDFSDEPFWDGRTTADARPGKVRTIADTRLWMRAFFDGTVRGDWNSLKRLAADSALTRSGVTVTVYQKPWPQ